MNNDFASKINFSLSSLEKNWNAISEWCCNSEIPPKNKAAVEIVKNNIYFEDLLSEPDSKGDLATLRIYCPEQKMDFKICVRVGDEDISGLTHLESLEIRDPYGKKKPQDYIRIDKAINIIRAKIEPLFDYHDTMAELIISNGYIDGSGFTQKQREDFINAVYISCVSFYTTERGIAVLVYLNDKLGYLKREVSFTMSENNLFELYGWNPFPIQKEN